jgi:hypothetical protein
MTQLHLQSPILTQTHSPTEYSPGKSNIWNMACQGLSPVAYARAFLVYPQASCVAKYQLGNVRLRVRTEHVLID